MGKILKNDQLVTIMSISHTKPIRESGKPTENFILRGRIMEYDVVFRFW